MIRFSCKKCGRKFKVSDTQAGKKGKCPGCKNIIIVPQPVSSSPVHLPPEEEEPLKLKYDSDPPSERDRPVYTMPPQEHRSGPELSAGITSDTYNSESAAEQKPATILNVFTFPFSLAGILHFIFFWFTPILFIFFLPVRVLGQIFRVAYGILRFAFYSYLFYYMSSCVVAAAKNERFAPDTSLGNVTTVHDLFCHMLRLVVAVFVCFGPSAGYALYHYGYILVSPTGQTDTIYWLLYGSGVFFFPMFLLAVTMFDSNTALNPFLIIGSIISTFLPYCGLVLLFCAIGLLMTFAGRLRPGGLSLFAWGLDIYLMFIAACVLGRFFRRYEDRLNWEIGL